MPATSTLLTSMVPLVQRTNIGSQGEPAAGVHSAGGFGSGSTGTFAKITGNNPRHRLAAHDAALP